MTRMVNDTLTSQAVVVHYGWMRVDGSESTMKSDRVCVEANGMVEVADESIAGCAELSPREWIYVAYAIQDDTVLWSSTWLLLPHRELAIPEPDIRVSVRGKTVRLVSETYCHGVHYQDDGRAVFSDNYFDLLPGVPKIITCQTPELPEPIPFRCVS